MPAKFKTFSFNSAARDEIGALATPVGLEGVLSSDEVTGPSAEALSFLGSDEAAARLYAEQLLETAQDDDLAATLMPEDAAIVPGLNLARTEDLPSTGTRSLHFEQQSKSVPIFGTNAVVEIEAGDRRLVSFEAQLANEPDVSHIASLSAGQALQRLSDYCRERLELADIKAPALCYFASESSSEWHLAYHFRDIPAVTPDIREALFAGETHGHGLGPSPREDFLRFDYLIDAHNGDLLYYFSAQPFLDIPVLCQGQDEFSSVQQFYGRQKPASYELHDPLRNIATFDHGFQDIMSPIPADPIDHTSTDFGSSTTAGVSAHYHAKLVFDFFNNVLKRNGVDDKGMRLVSVVNCTYSGHGGGKNWRNAVWYNNRMWYGQVASPGGGFDSYSRYLDVVAHELSHGVTQTTSNLVYRDESGALNESFSDIFGVMVANWYPNEPNPVSSWNWKIGDGLGNGGMPLRDLSNPQSTGHPAHWNDRQHIGTPFDNGGVHINSNIHNKAAYNLLTTTDPDGNPVLSPVLLALFYYLTLTRLSRRATFSDCKRVLRSVAASYFRGDPAGAAAARTAIDNAYNAVGIT